MTHTLPDGLRLEVEEALDAVTGSGRIRSTAPVGGGSINAAARIQAEDGAAYFLKWNAGADADFFEVEADGLRALHDAAPPSIAVPEPLAVGRGEAGHPPWLLLPFLERGAPDPGWEEELGHGLAEIHRNSPPAFADRFGWHRDNVIGALPQSNTPTVGWSDFWREHRIVPQLQSARGRGWFQRRSGEVLDRLVDRMDEALAGTEADPPALLHGDLWGGNVFGTSDGRAAIVDPAVYVGHHEVDLAMSELFGFPERFRAAYRESRPTSPGYEARRRDLYQLYYLLVHVNLFGQGYVSGSVRAAERVLASL